MTIFLIVVAAIGWIGCVLLQEQHDAAIAQIPDDAEIQADLPDNVYLLKDGSFVKWGDDDE